jgi:hypothetical protein
MAQVGVRGVEDCVWEEFKEYVKREKGKLHTVLGREAGVALVEYLKAMRGKV